MSPVRKDGFTLIEMVVVLAVFALVVVYVGRILAVNERAYHTVEQTSDSQQSLRIFGEMIEDEVRHAGMMVELFGSLCGVDNTAVPDILYVSDAAAIDAQDDFLTYPGATITNASNLNVGSSQVLDLDTLVMEPSPPNRPAYDTDGNGTLDSDFRVNGGVIVFDISDPDRGTACGRITAVDVPNERITVVAVSDLGGTATPNLRAVPANEYRLNGTQLQWNGYPMAENIEDFQVAYIFDFDDDNVIQPGERFGDGVGATYDSASQSGATARELLIALVARTRRPDPDYNVGRPQALLNRAATNVNDGFRRRTLETRVRLRNLTARIQT